MEGSKADKESVYLPWLLLVYEIVVLVVWSWLIIDHRYHIESLYNTRNWDLALVIPLCIVTGSMSAASFAIYGMYKHMIHQNFGTRFAAWYLSKPIVGAMMGGFAGVVFGAIFSTLGASTPAAHATLIGVAFLAGSNERFSAQLIETFTKKIFGADKNEQSEQQDSNPLTNE